MKNRFMKTMIAMVLALSTVLFTAGCGANVNVKINAPSKEDKAAAATEQVYKSSEGWSVKYDPSIISVKEGNDRTTFVYNGGSAGEDTLTVSYKEGAQPEQTIEALAKGWGNADSVLKGEGYFPGTNDKWGFWWSLADAADKSGISEDAFAGEYNGGVLVFDFATHNANSGSWQVLNSVLDTITYENFAPQTMYAGMAGTYTLKGTEEIEGQQVPYEYSVTLNDDHSGVIRLQDDLYVMWGLHSLIQADNSYDYSINGNTLSLNLDGNWLEFTK